MYVLLYLFFCFQKTEKNCSLMSLDISLESQESELKDFSLDSRMNLLQESTSDLHLTKRAETNEKFDTFLNSSRNRENHVYSSCNEFEDTFLNIKNTNFMTLPRNTSLNSFRATENKDFESFLDIPVPSTLYLPMASSSSLDVHASPLVSNCKVVPTSTLATLHPISAKSTITKSFDSHSRMPISITPIKNEPVRSNPLKLIKLIRSRQANKPRMEKLWSKWNTSSNIIHVKDAIKCESSKLEEVSEIQQDNSDGQAFASSNGSNFAKQFRYINSDISKVSYTLLITNQCHEVL